MGNKQSVNIVNQPFDPYGAVALWRAGIDQSLIGDRAGRVIHLREVDVIASPKLTLSESG
jgi:hypothetical protein